MVDGTPNRETQPLTKVCATVSAVLSAMGKASGQRVNLSTHVSKYVHPCEVGRGPTRFMCTWLKRASGVLKVPNGVTVWRCTLAHWHWRQLLAHLRRSAFIPGQKKWEAIRCCVALIPGCARSCKELNTVHRKFSGTNGCGVLVDVSQRS